MVGLVGPKPTLNSRMQGLKVIFRVGRPENMRSSCEGSSNMRSSCKAPFTAAAIKAISLSSSKTDLSSLIHLMYSHYISNTIEDSLCLNHYYHYINHP
nr:hypothetical protein Iba_chr15dCG5700 [Ipomoea batatas]